MTILLPALAVAFAAFCVWLGVRIVNRRERWAKWTAVAMIALPVLYVASFGPAHGIICAVDSQWLWRVADVVYRPLALTCGRSDVATRSAFRYADACEWRRPRIASGIHWPPGFTLDLESTYVAGPHNPERSIDISTGP